MTNSLLKVEAIIQLQIKNIIYAYWQIRFYNNLYFAQRILCTIYIIYNMYSVIYTIIYKSIHMYHCSTTMVQVLCIVFIICT